MELLIFLFWFLLVVGIPVGLIVATYIGYVRAVPKSRFAVGWGIGLGFHIVAVGLSFFPVFLMLYAGAHTTPVGNALDWQRRIIFLVIEFLYTLVAIGLLSFVAGRSRPWPIPERKVL